MKLKQNMELFMLCILIGIGIVYLKLFASYPENMVNIIRGVWLLVTYYLEIAGFKVISDFLQMFSANQLFFMFVLIHIVVGAVLVGIFKNRFQKGADIILASPYKVIRWGLLWYFLMVATMLIFLISVVGIPVAGVVFTLLFVISALGGVSIAVALGINVRRGLNVKSKSVFVSYLLGEFVLSVCTSVGVFTGVVLLFILPVFSLGTVWCAVMNRFVYKGIPDDFDDDTNKFDRNRIRDIITNGVD